MFIPKNCLNIVIIHCKLLIYKVTMSIIILKLYEHNKNVCNWVVIKDIRLIQTERLRQNIISIGLN